MPTKISTKKRKRKGRANTHSRTSMRPIDNSLTDKRSFFKSILNYPHPNKKIF